MFHRPEATNVQVQQQFSSPQEGSFNIKVTGSATVNTTFWRLIGQDQVNISASGESRLGHQKAQSRARPRQHRLDGVEQQDDGPQRGRSQPAQHASEGGEDARRHQGLDHPVRGRRQCRNRARQRVLDPLGRVGREQRHLQQVLVQQQEQLHQQHRHLDAQGPQSVEWLRDGSRPEQRRQRDPDRRRRRGQLSRSSGDGVSGGDDAAIHRLDGAERQDRRDDPDRQHQRHDRNADGVADADGGGAVQCARARRPTSTR